MANISCESLELESAGALKLKLIAIASTLLAGVAGIAIPLLIGNGKHRKFLRCDGSLFVAGKAFAAGVLLATGFVHMLSSGNQALTDPCLPLPKLPFSGFFALIASLAALLVDDFVGTSTESGVRHVVVSQIFELGIVSQYSILIGPSLGVSQTPCTIRPLIVALSFHQFFEGFALGGSISQAYHEFKSSLSMATTIFMALACFFVLVTTPAGIGIGTAIATSYINPYTPEALFIEGSLDSLSAGFLVYMAFVHLIAADFLSKRMSCSNFTLQLLSYFMLFLGAAIMSSLAIGCYGSFVPQNVYYFVYY